MSSDQTTWENCPRCHGTGEVMRPTSNGYYVTGPPEPVRCPKCFGHGLVKA